LDSVGHRFGTGPWLFRNVDLDLEPGGRLGVVGANGTGKSTLLEVLAGRIVPAEGEVERGPTVRLGLYDQTGRELDPAQRVREAVAGNARQPDWSDARLMEQFWFDGDAQRAPIGTLSGGERRRLQLLLVLAEHPNVLLLDEPTNDLDLDTLRMLEDFVDSWPGSMVVVSHDRTLLERTVTDVIALDGNGHADRVGTANADWTSATPRPEAVRAAGPRSASTLRRLVAAAEKEVAKLEARRDRLAGDVATAGGDYSAHARLGDELAAVNEQLAAAEHRWLELAEGLEY